MAKVPIKKAAPAPPSCLNCVFRDPDMMEGATKVLCMRYPRREHMRITDWCGEFKLATISPAPSDPAFTVSVKEA